MLRFDRRLIQHFDWVSLLMLFLVSAMAMVNLYSSTWGGGTAASPVFYRQLYYLLAGLILAVLLLCFDYHELESFGFVFYGAVILLLLYANLFVDSVAGTTRWIDFGFFRLQPSEPAKFILVVVLAGCFAQHDPGKRYRFRDLVRPFVLTVVPFVLILVQPDLGTALMMIILFVSYVPIIKIRVLTLAILGAIAAGISVIGWKFFLKDYQRLRVETFLNPESDPANQGYQVMQSKIAVGSGQILGKGFLEGTQGHLHFLPERHTDFAFSVWAEEWGFIGCVFFLGCYFFMLLWGINIALNSKDKFGSLLAYGLVMLIFWQAVINLFMIMGLLPVVGIPLPLFSYGGSSLVTTIICIAILMNIRMRSFGPQP